MKRLYFSGLGAVAALVVTAAAPAAAAPAATPAEILQAGADLGVRDGYPGVIGLARSGADVQYAHAGNSDRFAGVAAKPTDQFRIGSNTKAFVSTVLLQLEGEGKLSLDDPVAKWLPGVINSGGYDGTKITIRQLLNHTSGLADYLGDVRVNAPYAANIDPHQAWPPQTLLNIALSDAKTGEPGEHYSYSNTNYLVAGLVIKAVTGNDAPTEIQHRIIEPLGLAHTTFPTTDPALHGDHLNGYFWVGGLLIRDVTTSNVQVSTTAGAMVSTLDDLATFERALLSGALLAPAQQAELTTTVPIGDAPEPGYGLGILHAQTPCGGVWEHTGGVLGYFTLWLTSDDGSKQVVVAANEFHLIGGTKGQTDVGNAALNAYCALS